MKHVTPNIPSCFSIVWIVALSRIISQDSSVNVRDVAKVLIREHFLCNILAEFLHLFANILQKGNA